MTPAPNLLTRHQIVAAAIDLVDRDGLDAFSMRRLGAALGVDPMAVYHHVPNKAALFDAIVDEVWAMTSPEPPRPGEGWREVAASSFVALRRVLLTHPRLVAILGSRPIVTPHMLAQTERSLGWLADAGLPPASAMQLLDCLMAYTVGKVQGEVRDPVGGVGVPPEEVWAALTPDTHPRIVEAMASGYDWQPEEEFTRGLTAMLVGWSEGHLSSRHSTG